MDGSPFFGLVENLEVQLDDRWNPLSPGTICSSRKQTVTKISSQPLPYSPWTYVSGVDWSIVSWKASNAVLACKVDRGRGFADFVWCNISSLEDEWMKENFFLDKKIESYSGFVVLDISIGRIALKRCGMWEASPLLSMMRMLGIPFLASTTDPRTYTNRRTQSKRITNEVTTKKLLTIMIVTDLGPITETDCKVNGEQNLPRYLAVRKHRR